MPISADITRHHEPVPGDNPWIGGAPKPEPIELVAYDASWPAAFAGIAGVLRASLGDAAIAIDHIGSTSVPGLAAKPVIDVDLTVSDPADEAAYVPFLENSGFILVIREPGWHEHRCLQLSDPRSNIHVFGPDCPEIVRHRMFRDWLIAHPDDCELYHRAKLAAAKETTARGGLMTDYNRHKEPVLHAIYERMFRAHGLLDR
jgi:GrpB-like predicted nucleotidyltransferase (UPF0157 family)